LKVPETPEPLSGLPTKIALESGMPHRYLFYRAVAASRGGNFGVGQREKLWREFFFRSFAVV
jgi:hypothetical protein